MRTLFYKYLNLYLLMPTEQQKQHSHIKDQIISIRASKTVENKQVKNANQQIYLVQWKLSKQKSWESIQKIPPSILQSYKRTLNINIIKQKVLDLQQIQENNQGQGQLQLKKGIEIQQKDSQKQIDKKEKRKHYSHNKKQLKDRKQSSKDMDVKEVDILVAQVSSSHEDIDQLSSEDIEKVQKNLKQPKMKVKKQKVPLRVGKQLVRRSRQAQIIENNVLTKQRTRQKQKRSYYDQESKQGKASRNARKKNLKQMMINVQRDIQKSTRIQKLLIDSVLQSGECGDEQKHYLVRLRDNQVVLISETNMNIYFPRKLLQFYRRVVSKLSVSTQKGDLIN